MLFRFIFNLLKNLRWILTLVFVLGGIYLVLTQYQAIKATPLGSFLPSVTIPPLSSLVSTQTTTPTPTVSTELRATERVSITTAKGKVTYNSEVARTVQTQALGLMYRTTLPQYSGMYFVFDTDTTVGFWMKNCEIPLDMIFINSTGVIVDIKENMRPCKETDPKQEMCATYIPKEIYRTVLEINGGSTKTNSIAIGQKVTLEN